MTVLGVHGENEERTALRVEVLTDVITCRRPLSESRQRLANFGWDSAPLVPVTTDDLSAVIRSFIDGNVSAGFVEEWAETLESREDVYFADQVGEKVIFVLANPALEGELGTALARELLAALQPWGAS
ncbi:hypothetical protein [Conyzicola sp.]|uniref:hypothetical protein n=1 Tax=Conyzicola sp. TaxID=1969404 RepID=UPI0039896024